MKSLRKSDGGSDSGLLSGLVEVGNHMVQSLLAQFSFQILLDSGKNRCDSSRNVLADWAILIGLLMLLEEANLADFLGGKINLQQGHVLGWSAQLVASLALVGLDQASHFQEGNDLANVTGISADAGCQDLRGQYLLAPTDHGQDMQGNGKFGVYKAHALSLYLIQEQV